MKVAETTLVNLPHKAVNTEFGILYLFESTIINEINDGHVFTPQDVHAFLSIVKDFYNIDQSVSYISNRVNSYSIEPGEYDRLKKFKDSLVHYIVVTADKLMSNTHFIEKRILDDVPIHYTTSIEIAYSFANPSISPTGDPKDKILELK